jgi:hypothetical protein
MQTWEQLTKVKLGESFAGTACLQNLDLNFRLIGWFIAQCDCQVKTGLDPKKLRI